MHQALALARQAAQAGEVPVGAVLVAADEVIGRGSNRVISDCDPSAHAEIVALRQAALRARNYRLPNTTLYVTLEPCAMCAGALIQARVERVVFAAADPIAGAAGSVFQVLDERRLNHRCRVEGGLLAAESTAMLQAFFRARR